jgi:hypothetical protein
LLPERRESAVFAALVFLGNDSNSPTIGRRNEPMSNKLNHITLPECAITTHGGVEFGVHDGRHFVRCEGTWCRIAEADYNMILARHRANPTHRLYVSPKWDWWLTFSCYDGQMRRIEVPIISLIDPDNWSMTSEVTFPDFSPERLIAQDPEPELCHPFAFVDSGRSKGYFIRGGANGEEVWARISKEDWDRALELFHGNDEDGDYHETGFPGVLANDEYRCVFVDVNPCSERGEVWVKVRPVTDDAQDGQAA